MKNLTKEIILAAMNLGTARYEQESWDDKREEIDFQADEVLALVERMELAEKIKAPTHG